MKYPFSTLFLMVIFGGILFSCNPINHRQTLDISGFDWTAHQRDSDLVVKAKVPGCIHTDLLRNNLIPDPYFRDNEKELQWIGEKDWEYSCYFDVPQELGNMDNLELCFKGLDTHAQVYLNDSLVLEVDNFFREWRVNCRDFLGKNGNKLRIVFTSPEKVNRRKKKQSSIPLFDDYVYSRKPAYHFGWDWGPVFITVGVWKPVVLEGWNHARIMDLNIVQEELTKDRAKVTLIYEIEADKECQASLNSFCPTTGQEEDEKIGLKTGTNVIITSFTIDDPKLWWTNGLGEAHLYEFLGKLKYDGTTIDEITRKTGLRTLKLVQKPDSLGRSFHFELNGVPVFMKGANYIPQDLFLNRPTKDDYVSVIKQALDANMNMLRVWGGGFYENDLFYDLCDAKGILVWQDFMFACSMYPGDSLFLDNVKQEAIQNVKRLRNHPCIGLWCGNNENYIGWKDWRWSRHFPKEDSATIWHDYEKLYHQLLPGVVAQYDSSRFYWPSSPKHGWGYPVNGDGDVHYWGVWHAQEPFENFEKKEFIGRFMSEYGFQGCPEFSSIKKFTKPEDWDIHSDVMLLHQKHRIGYPVIDKYMTWYYQKPKDFKSYLYASQVLQAYGIGKAIEAHRRAMPHCMGTLYWQINDCYPVTSWASIDCYGKWKALHYKTREVYKEVLISPFSDGENLDVYVVSDRLKDFEGMLNLKLLDLKGRLIKDLTREVIIKANLSKSYYSVPVARFLKGKDKRRVALQVELSENKEGEKPVASSLYYFALPKDLKLSDPHVQFECQKVEHGYELLLSSDYLAKDLFLATKSGEGFFSNNFFDLVPGKPQKITLEIATGDFNPNEDIEVFSLFDSY